MGVRFLGNAILAKEEQMRVWQIIDDSIVDQAFVTKEGAAMRLLELVMKSKNPHLVDLLRVEEFEAK